MESHGEQSNGGSSAKIGDSEPRSDAEQRLITAVAAVTQNSGSRIELEAAARELVEQLRAEHEPAEEVLLRIKRALSGLEPGAAVYRDVIVSSIRQYYGATS